MSNSGTFLAEALASTATEITEAVADAQRASEDAATQAGIATTGGATSTTQAGLATTANQQAQNALEQVQALANGTGVVAIIDSKANVALGNGAVGPNDVAGNADGNAPIWAPARAWPVADLYAQARHHRCVMRHQLSRLCPGLLAHGPARGPCPIS
jgi:hypothetical protein